MAETFVFTIRREGPERTGAQAEALYEAGLDDCGADTGPAYTLVDAAREAPDYPAAAGSVLAGIARALPGLPAAFEVRRG